MMVLQMHHGVSLRSYVRKISMYVVYVFAETMASQQHCITDSRQQKEKIIADTGAVCAEMEGASIAHTAYRNGVPFVILRAISDKADDSAEMDYPTFTRLAASHSQQVVEQLLSR